MSYGHCFVHNPYSCEDLEVMTEPALQAPPSSQARLVGGLASSTAAVTAAGTATAAAAQPSLRRLETSPGPLVKCPTTSACPTTIPFPPSSSSSGINGSNRSNRSSLSSSGNSFSSISPVSSEGCLSSPHTSPALRAYMLRPTFPGTTGPELPQQQQPTSSLMSATRTTTRPTATTTTTILATMTDVTPPMRFAPMEAVSEQQRRRRRLRSRSLPCALVLIAPSNQPKQQQQQLELEQEQEFSCFQQALRMLRLVRNQFRGAPGGRTSASNVVPPPTSTPTPTPVPKPPETASASAATKIAATALAGTTPMNAWTSVGVPAFFQASGRFKPCEHFSSWKRIRAKRGVSHHVCTRCGLRWKVDARASTMYLLTSPTPSTHGAMHPEGLW